MATTRRAFWQNRLHDLMAILLFLAMWSWRWDATFDPHAQLGIGYNKQLHFFNASRGTWWFTRDLLTQGRRPFHVMFGYSIGTSEGVIATNGPERRWLFVTPYWLVALVLLTPLFLSTIQFIRVAPERLTRFGRWIARKRAGPGCCIRCGYDLRATPDRCPECGTERAMHA